MTKTNNPHGRKDKIVNLVSQQNGKCYLCGAELTFQRDVPNSATVEHTMPKVALKEQFGKKVKGIAPWNEMAAGAACNAYKGKAPLNDVWSDLQEMRLCEAETWEEAAKIQLKHRERKLA